MKLPAVKHAAKYAALGVLLGLCFPTGAVAFLFFTGQLGAAAGIIDIVAQAHVRNSLLYIIDSAPLFLGLLAGIAGSRQDRIARFSQSLEAEIAEKTESLRLALEEATRANERITHLAEHDTLTGLLNRLRFQRELERWGEFALRYQRRAALIFIDIDKFKHVNDTFGHCAGDEYLASVADLLSHALRSTDSLARWGGDEFAILLPETGVDAALEVANKLIELFNDAVLFIGGNELRVSVSIGIALFPEHTRNINDLVRFADTAMYDAKQAGGNCFRLYSLKSQMAQRA